MKIKTLINVYKKLIPYYEKSINTGIVHKNLDYGICMAASRLCDEYIYDLFYPKGYYRNYIGPSNYLKIKSINSIKRLQFRLNFMKQEIIELQNLLSEGYTNV